MPRSREVSTSMRRNVIALALLALLAGPLPVAAQEGSTPAPLPTSAPRATPGVGGREPGVLDWEPVGPPFLREGRELRGLVSWRRGFALLEYRSSPRGETWAAAVWHSPDGRSWTRSRLPRRLVAPVTLLPFESGLVIAAEEPIDIRGYGFDYGFWRSSDGRSWRRVGSLSYRQPDSLTRRGCQSNHRDLASIDGALMLYVTLCWDPCCGLAPTPTGTVLAVLQPGSRERRTRGVIAWRSTDAAAWRRQPLHGMDQPDGKDYGIALRPATDELLALRKESGGQTLLRSADGLRWTPFGTIPEGFSYYGSLQLLPVDDHVLLIGESWELEGGDGNTLVAWVMEADGTTTMTLVRNPAVSTEAVVNGSTVLLLGRGWSAGESEDVDDDDEQWAWILGSRDGGGTWDEDLAWTGANGTCLDEVAQNDRVVVAVACIPGRPWPPSTEPSTPQSWVATLPAPSPLP